jgi:outer membrane protein OmpA-like peptidoglycan-associated protein
MIYLHWTLSTEEAGPFLSKSKQIWENLGAVSLVSQNQFDRGKEAIIQELKIEKGNRESINQVLNNAWSAANILYFLSIQDILEQVEIDDLQAFQERYIQNAFPFELIETSDSVYSEISLDTVMVETSEQLAKIQFTFAENEAEISEEQIPMLFAIRQYLINNPHILIQVNGFADKSEYLKVNDPSLDKMIKQYPRFQKVERNLISPNHIRLDMARSLYIIQYFLRGGIAPYRISGTSSLNKSKYKDQRYMNRKVTFSYDLIRSQRYMELINE